MCDLLLGGAFTVAEGKGNNHVSVVVLYTNNELSIGTIGGSCAFGCPPNIINNSFWK